ncbi:MAG: radical SAM protein [Candidatus Hodarchaeales archaeon]|jgi:23S rRNA (adenine2503-C2)-methyltransferase
MEILASTGRKDIATVYIAEFGSDKRIELVESIQPPIPLEEKWVFLVSTLFGCPVHCKFCDAGDSFKGKLTEDEILQQIDFLIKQRYPDGKVPVKQLKIQFARIGEPSFNQNVLTVLEKLPELYDVPGLMPSISTIAPKSSDRFLEKLLEIKNRYYSNGHFQMQFSIHTTDEKQRDELMPVAKWNFNEIAEYGKRFYQLGDRKITLNFALAKDLPLDPVILKKFFDPAIFLIKITPLNPTYRAKENNLESYFGDFINKDDPIITAIEKEGFEIVSSVGVIEENLIGSNCGQCIKRHEESEKEILANAYTYPVRTNNQ